MDWVNDGEDNKQEIKHEFEAEVEKETENEFTKSRKN